LTVLRGRRNERRAVDRLLAAARAGRSGVLVLRGEAGIGKSALLEYAVQGASGFRVLRATGVESEMELVFAGLHQLCAPLLDGVGRLPAPQRDALQTAFGLSAGAPPDRFFVGLAVLTLLSETAGERPLLCLVDDTQWLDGVLAQVLAFVARRLQAESVGLLFATRTASEPDELTGLPQLVLEGLADTDARELLRSAIAGPLDARVADRIIAETQGNPLALLELSHLSTPAHLAGGFGLPDALPLSGRIEESFRQRTERLPEQTQLLLLLAAAEPVGDPALLWRAAARLGLTSEAAAPAESDGLLLIGAGVRFRHPLVRSAVYRAASLSDRRKVHAALATVTDPEVDPDRRAWHRAQATPAVDEEVAAELERSAGRAQARGGLAAAGAFLEQATRLTPEAARQGERALAAAQTKLQAGAPDAALDLVATAEAGAMDDLGRARANLLRAQIAFATSRGREAPPLLLTAAQQLEPLDATLARETYLDALSAATFIGHLSGGTGVLEVAQAAQAAPAASQPPSAADLLLDGLALMFTEGYAAGGPRLKRALGAFRREPATVGAELRWFWLACRAALNLWDYETFDVLSDRSVQVTREAGALSEVPSALNARLAYHTFGGDLAAAGSLAEEAEVIGAGPGSPFPLFGALTLAALRGREDQVAALSEGVIDEVVRRGQGLGVSAIQYAKAVLSNGLGQYDDALASARQVADHWQEMPLSSLVLPELIEAAARGGKPDHGADALQRLSERARAGGTDWGLGIEAQSRALVTDGEAAEHLYREAIQRLGRTRVATALARAQLLDGSGCAGSAAVTTRASSCAPPIGGSRRSAWRRSPSAPPVSYWPPASARARE
jgi:AAA ATPase domain